MKLLMIITCIFLISAQSFAHDDHRGGDRGHGRGPERRGPPRGDDGDGILALSDSTLLLSYTSAQNPKEAAQVMNDAQDFIQTGTLSLLLNQKINEVQTIDQSLSVEDALDLIVSSAEATL